MKNRFIFQTLFGVALLAILFSIPPGARSTGAYITGVVIRSNRPLPSVWVIISQGGYEKGRWLTGDDGKYYFGDLGDGVYRLEVYRGNSQLSDEQVSLPGDTNHNIWTR